MPPLPSRSNHEAIAFTGSFVVLSVFGCFIILTSWAPFSPLLRCVGYVVILAGVHFQGYRHWMRNGEFPRTGKANGIAQIDRSTRHVTRFLVWLSVGLMLLAILKSLIL